MSFNFSELQQKADRVLFNADQFVRRYVDFALAPAQDITIQYYDQNGNLQTFTVPNRQKLVNQLYADLPNSMVRTFYVHQTNGNDNNAGTQQQPFKTLQKAISSVPPGGIGYIYLMSDYTLDNSLGIGDKAINIYLQGYTLTTTYRVENNYAIKHFISLSRADLTFNFPGQIVVPPAPSGVALAPSSYSFISTRRVSSILFHINQNTSNEYVFLDIRSGALAGYNHWDDGNLSFAYVGFLTHYNVTAYIANGAFLIQTFGRPFSIGLSFGNSTFNGFLKRPDGTVINNIADVIGGIVRDNAGIPRNIISNRVL